MEDGLGETIKTLEIPSELYDLLEFMWGKVHE
jgi:hypothetical protein